MFITMASLFFFSFFVLPIFSSLFFVWLSSDWPAHLWKDLVHWCAPCGIRGCKNRLAPFPGQMSYKMT